MTTRWQFRMFGPDFSGTDALLREHTDGMCCRDEIHLVSPRHDVHVTIRDGVLDIQILQRIESGLEQWTSALREPFPIDASVAAATLGLWHIREVDAGDAVYSEQALLALIAQTMPTVAAVPVSEVCRTGQLDGCLLEHADVLVDGRRLQTLVVQGDGPEHVLAVLSRFGFGPGENVRAENVNYVRAIQRILRSPSSPTAMFASATIAGQPCRDLRLGRRAARR